MLILVDGSSLRPHWDASRLDGQIKTTGRFESESMEVAVEEGVRGVGLQDREGAESRLRLEERPNIWVTRQVMLVGFIVERGLFDCLSFDCNPFEFSF